MMTKREPKFDETTLARINAWHQLSHLLDNVLETLRTLESECDEDTDLPVAGEVIPLTGVVRKTVYNMEQIRRAVLSTPTPGQNAGSKLARGMKEEAAFTPDDLVRAIPDRDHDAEMTWALQVLQDLTPRLVMGRQPSAMNEAATFIKALLRFRVTPRGGAEISKELSDLREGNLPTDLASMLDDIDF